MEIFTIEEAQERWEELVERAENGEHIGIVKEDGTAAVLMPADEEMYRIYRYENNEAS